MKNFIYIFSLILGFGLVGCDDFLDVNDDPNRVTEVSLSAQLPPIIERTSSTHFSMANSIAQITQQTGSYFEYPDNFTMAGSWSTVYLRSLSNAKQIIENAEEQAAPHYAGVARVIMALNLGLATDAWEDIPYSEAFNGSENLSPAYDSQESIYAEITSLLDKAISDLNATESFLSPGSDDLVYGGDLSKWVKLAYALKARYQLHLINKNGVGSILTDVASSFESSADNFQLTYNDELNLNPWHTSVALANNTGNVSISYGSYFIDLINGTLINAADPRVNVILDTAGVGTPVGITSYDENAAAHNVDFEENNWYSMASSPIVMVTYAELKFIEAEAALSTNRGRAYDAYLAGIAGHMAMLGIDDASTQAYLSSPAVGVGADALTLDDILKQKYIALFLNPEAWVDMRRVGYENYDGFVIPDPSLFNGPAQRANYPDDELNRNGAAVTAAQKPYDQKMWRDL